MESGSAQLEICDTTNREVAGKVRSLPANKKMAWSWIRPLSSMPIEFKTLPMMALRSSAGEVLDEVSRNGTAFLIERKGQQKACLVPISHFLPDIQTSRLTRELDRLEDAKEHYRVSISEDNEIRLLFKEFIADSAIDVTVVLPHGYPSKAPVVSACPIEDGCPHLWPNGTLCIYGAMAVWNPGKHDVMHTIALFRRWIQGYTVWMKTGVWSRGGAL